MTPRDHIGKAEIRKDALQDTVEATAAAVGTVTTIVTGAVRDIARAVGGLANDVFEIGEAARRASTEAGLDDAGAEDAGAGDVGPERTADD